LIIEGGSKTLSFFIKNNLWDEAKIFKTKVKLDKGLISPKLEQKEKNIISIGTDKLHTYINF
jgi:diaminohydroxyphosphoribosylaminopyrimidine deaminase/5-amino-6-(5-phosphoribosylamino)uracil reductase